MSKKKLYRLLFISAWVVVLSSVTVLLLSANSKSTEHVCKGIKVSIKGEAFKPITEEEIIFNVEKFAKGAMVNRSMTSIDLPLLEKHLEEDAWIKNAEIYFDSKNLLNISIWERTPIARVFTVAGNSIYLDEEGKILPLTPTPSSLPVVTGFTAAKRWNAKDSSTFEGVRNIVHYLATDAFWNAQVASIDIDPYGMFEFTPLVGDHRIKIGTPTDIAEKLHNVKLFYQQVSSKVGFNKYSAINAAFKNQIVAERKGTRSSIDSIQLQTNIQNLLKNKEQQLLAEQDAQATFNENNTAEINEPPKDIKPLRTISVPVKTKPSPIQKSVAVKSTPKKAIKPVTPIQKTKALIKPKAIMQKKAQNEY